MAKFIEVTADDGGKRLINTAWIEEIFDSDGQAIIFYAVTPPLMEEQDWVKVKESYAEIKDMIFDVYKVNFDPGFDSSGLWGRGGKDGK